MQQPPYGYPQQPPQKQGRSTGAKILIALGAVSAAGFGGCVLCVAIGAGVSRSKSPQAEAQPVASTATPKAVAPEPERSYGSVGVARLLADYKANEVRADNTYKGKYVAISGGTVDDVKKGLLDGMYVMVGTGKQFEIPQVQCHLGDDQAAKAAALSKGDKATVRGRIDGLMGHVHIQECEIQ